jgi:hypothetical protein
MCEVGEVVDASRAIMVPNNIANVVPVNLAETVLEEGIPAFLLSD